MRRAVLLLSVLMLAVLMLALPGGALGEDRAFGDIEVFAEVSEPGMPEGIAVRDGVVYVGTHASVRGNGGGPPSRIFRYDLADGSPLGSFEVAGQATSATHGLLGMAFDAEGRLYALDRNPPRVLRFDLSTDPPAQHTYATIPDLPACRPGVGPATACSPTTLDQAAFPDGFAFAPDGSMFVTDLEAATIFRVPAGGGAAEIWYQDARFDGIFGLNGIAVSPGGDRLFFAMTGSQQPETFALGIIYSFPIGEPPTPEDLEVFHVLEGAAAGPDGIGFGADGALYVALAGANQVAVIGPDGSQTARFPEGVENQMRDVPVDLPASVAFDGAGSMLMTNQSFFTAVPEHWVVFDVWVDDPGLPLRTPSIAG